MDPWVVVDVVVFLVAVDIVVAVVAVVAVASCNTLFLEND